VSFFYWLTKLILEVCNIKAPRKVLPVIIKRVCILCVITIIMILPNPIVLATELNFSSLIIDSIKRAYGAGDYQGAYHLSQDNIFELEGNTEFDFYYGMVALKLEKYDEARFAFERLVQLYPDVGRYRLEYASTLFFAQQYDQAAEQLDYVMAQNPPDKVRENIAHFHKLIKDQRQFNSENYFGSIALGSGFDTNINSATDLDSIGAIRLTESAQSTDSAFSSLKTAFGYYYEINQLLKTGVSVDSQHKHNHEMNDFDIDTIRLKTFLEHSLSANHQWRIGISHLEVLLSSNRYEHDQGVFFEWQSLDQHSYLSAQLAYYAKNFADSDALEAYQPTLLLAFVKPKQRLLHAITFFMSSDQARSDSDKASLRDSLTIGYNLKYRFSKTLSWSFDLSSTRNQYKAQNLFFGKTRDDITTQFGLGLNWGFSQKLSTSVNLTQAHNFSNLDLYDYDRSKLELTLELAL